MRTTREKYAQLKNGGMFVTDLDGTLLTDGRLISSVDLEMLSHLQNIGIVTAVATGRSDYSFNVLFDGLESSLLPDAFPLDYVIFSTGAGIMNYPERKIMKSFSLGKKDVLCIADYLRRSHHDFMIHAPVPDTRSFLYSTSASRNADFYTRLKLYKDFAKPLTKTTLQTVTGATEVLCIVPHESGHHIATEIARDLKQFSVIKATSPLDGKSVWIEIFAPEVSKSQAVCWLSESIGIQRENVCAVGNDYNDEDLLHWAGQGFLVANGPQVLSVKFESVSSNNENGVSEAAFCWLKDSLRDDAGNLL